MIRVISRALFIVLILKLSAVSCQSTVLYADTVSSKELIENAKLLDGKIVTYKGEIVTAILNRGEYSWINLNDGDNAIGVWCKTSQLNIVKFVGDYKNRGDTLEVGGVFNRACPIHGGELDIHAQTLNIIQSGYITEGRIDKRKLIISIFIFLLTLSIAVIFRKRI